MSNKTPSQAVRSLNLVEAILPIASLIILVGLSYFLFGDDGAKGPNKVTAPCAAPPVGGLRSFC